MHQLFVYGTLRKGGLSHHLLQGAQLLQQQVPLEGYALYDAGWYPVAVPAASEEVIVGDVLAVPLELWPQLDAYEGEAYERIYLADQQLWIYQFFGAVDGLQKVPGGDWLLWQRTAKGKHPG